MESAVREGFEKYADFSGTTTRANYWWWNLFTLIVIFVSTFVDVVLGTTFIANVATLAILVPSVAITTRRMHDVGRSGWYQLVPFYNLFLVLSPSRRQQ